MLPYYNRIDLLFIGVLNSYFLEELGIIFQGLIQGTFFCSSIVQTGLSLQMLTVTEIVIKVYRN